MIKPLFSESHTNKFSRFGDKTNISSENDPAGLRYTLELAILLFHFIDARIPENHKGTTRVYLGKGDECMKV